MKGSHSTAGEGERPGVTPWRRWIGYLALVVFAAAAVAIWWPRGSSAPAVEDAAIPDADAVAALEGAPTAPGPVGEAPPPAGGGAPVAPPPAEGGPCYPSGPAAEAAGGQAPTAALAGIAAAIVELRRDVDALRSRLGRLETQQKPARSEARSPGGASGSEHRGPAPSTVEVLLVDGENGFAVVDRGAAEGVTAGLRYGAARRGEGAFEVRIDEVRDRVALGRVVPPGGPERVRPGDRLERLPDGGAGR